MIKLITQFDNEKTKLSLATPTCGCCCCCCCCCIISTFAAAGVSARNFGDYVEKKLPNEPKKIKLARGFGFVLPLGLIAILFLTLLYTNNNDVSDSNTLLVLSGFAYLFIMGCFINSKLGISGLNSRIVGHTLLLIGCELVGLCVGFFALVYLQLGYLILAVIVSIFLIWWAFEKKYDSLDNNTNKEKIENKEDKINNESNNEDSTDIYVNEDNNDKAESDNEENKKEKHEGKNRKKKKCPNCGTENAVENRTCIYCAVDFKDEDKK